MVANSNYYESIAAIDVLSADQELETAREVEARDVAVWKAVLAHPDGRRWVRSSMRSVDPGELRAGDPDREGLERVLDGLAARCGDRDYLAAVSRANSAALQARNALVLANLRLVVKAAREFDFGMLPLQDLIQEGNLGLLKATGRYDHRRGVRFATYAVWWIRHTMRRAIAQKGRLVRLPVNVINGGHRIGKAQRELASALGRAPSNDEIAEAVEMPSDRVTKLRAALAQRATSIERSDDDDNDGWSLLDEAPSEERSPADRVEAGELFRELRGALAQLTPIEVDVLRERFGLDGCDEQTLSRIGERFGVSRERIRQIQQRALEKLRVVLAG